MQIDYPATIATDIPPAQITRTPFRLGLEGIWNVRFEDQLRLARPDSTIRPVTTKLNVFTSRNGPSSGFIVPTQGSNQEACVTCQLWDITSSTPNFKCDDCRVKAATVPTISTLSNGLPKARLVVPRLAIPDESQPKPQSEYSFVTRCSACEIAALIDPAHPTTCPSCTPDPTLLSPISPRIPSKVKRSSARRPPTKLQIHALRCLQGWLKDNRHNPYPDTETKRSLAQECGITERQVTTWFTNARARRMVTPTDPSNAASDDEGTYSIGQSSTASTPIYNSSTPAPYMTALDHRRSDIFNPAASGSNQTPLRTPRRGRKKDYGGMVAISPTPQTPTVAYAIGTTGTDPETWQCTFCYQHVAPKSWRRHEETQHRSKRTWTCLRSGPRLTVSSQSGSSTVCAFCMENDPSDAHFLQSHRITECLKKTDAERTFLRPDHLRQHVKNFHKATLLENVRDFWRRDGAGKDDVENWVCGFCDEVLKTWAVRQTHIAGHFKDGSTMAQWKGYSQQAATESTKKRRNSTEEHSSVFAKLSRTFSGRSSRHQPQHHPHNELAHAFDPLSISRVTNDGVSTASLMPDVVFDTLMAEVCADNFEFSDALASNSNAQAYVPAVRYDSAINDDDEDLELDFDTLTEAFLNGDADEFQGFWNTQLD